MEVTWPRLGHKAEKAEPLASNDALWQQGALGDHTPQCLLDSMIFYLGMSFGLRSGDEHRRLRFHPCQIEVKQNKNGQQYLLYTEDVSKNHRGGLVDRKVKPKLASCGCIIHLQSRVMCG